MPRDYINMNECPFRVGDLVRDEHTKQEAQVIEIADEHVYCFVPTTGVSFYRTWTHDLDTLMHRSGGGLTRLSR